MSLQYTPASDRIRIGIFGRRNAGKSSLINAITGQPVSVVSDQKGTTTDPVQKAMELLPLGPVLLIDTPGMDDEGVLGALRIEKMRQVLETVDLAIVVTEAEQHLSEEDLLLTDELSKRQIPFLIAWNKHDLLPASIQPDNLPASLTDRLIPVSAATGEGISLLKERLSGLSTVRDTPMVRDLIKPLQLVLLVVPIDASAPKGRLILPQQQVIRETLECGALSLVVRDTELAKTLALLSRKPDLVITDSQVFRQAAEIVPEDIPLTSFSILMARKKGILSAALEGVSAIDGLKDKDPVLIAEGCTHHRQCEDIGTVKLPRLIRSFTGAQPAFSFCSGKDFPADLSGYRLVIHCGGCMLHEKEIRQRLQLAQAQHVPITNYGIAIAHMRGILERSIAPLNER